MVTTTKQKKNQENSEIAGIHLTHPDKVLYPEQGITKMELARFYEEIADWILPHVVERPLTVVRCPGGYEKSCFYQKHVNETVPKAIQGVPIKEKDETNRYIFIKDLSGLIALTQMGVLEIHPWGSKVDDVDKPDRMVFDLDPGEGVDWNAIVRGAELLRERLEELGLKSYVKTSGGKGLHVVVPLTRRNTWEEMREFSKALSKSVEEEDPERYISVMSKNKRSGKIFVDYLRNSRGATSVAAYSSRAKKGATVSTPVRWNELQQDLTPDKYNISNLRKRLSSVKQDPWKGFFDVNQSLTAAMKKKLGIED